MNKLTLIFTIIINLLFISCEMPFEGNDGNEFLPGIEPQTISFVDMKVGQKSIYVGFKGTFNWGETPTSYEYTKDSIIVEVIEKIEENIFKIEETHIINSKDVGSKSFDYAFEITDNRIEIVPEISDTQQPAYNPWYISQIYQNGESLGSFINIEETGDLAEFDGWTFRSNVHGEYHQKASISDFKSEYNQFDKLYAVVNYKPTTYDAGGSYLLFSKVAGLVRRLVYNPWTNNFGGFELSNFAE
jgi:hypothetical protein